MTAKRYDVAAYVWPAYHPDDRAKIFWPDGIGEWQTVASSKPRDPGHEQPRHPLWGFINEADAYVAEMEIAAAADHGVNVFIFDWYWYDGLPFLEGHLNDGYLKARNNDRVKFYLMWANHDVPLIWDKRNADDLASQRNRSLVWRGDIDRREFEKIAQRWIEKYFPHPSYYRIDGKPVFMLYDWHKFIKGMGGIEPAREALEWFRHRVQQAGFAGLELQLALRDPRTFRLEAPPDEGLGSPREIIHQLGFDSLTHYQFFHFLDVDRDYTEIVKDAATEWNVISSGHAAKYYPHVSMGWDSSPRFERYVGSVTRNNTPANFEQALIRARDFVDAHADQAPLITLNSWNEWTETSYLQPCTKYGYGYLQAVKNVFVNKK